MIDCLLWPVRIAARVLRFAVVVLFGALVIAGTTPAAGAAEGAQFPRNPTIPTEVVIIGTQHSAQLEYEDHAPAHFRALLNRIDPAAVGVETPPWWYERDVFYEIAYESYGVGVPWAVEKGREIRAVDWQPVGMAFVNTIAWPMSVASTSQAGARSEEVGEEPEMPDTTDLLFADTPAWRDGINRSYAYADINPTPYGEAVRRYMLYRNLMIAREIVNMAADFEGERVVVLIGAAHKPDLDLFLATVPNIVIRHASEWKGVTEAEIAAEERRPDHLAILWYNLAGSRVKPEDVDVARMDTLLEGLEGEATGAEVDSEVAFLRARWHVVQGDTATALAMYEALVWEHSWTDRSFTYPDRDLAERVHTWWNTEELLMGEPEEFGLANVLSPVANLTIRQRILYELARQHIDPAVRGRARAELTAENFNLTQHAQLQALLEH